MVWLHYIIAGIGDTIDHWWFLPPLFLAGVGLGLGFSALFQLVLSAVPPRDAGAGAGSLQAFQQVGGAIGVALIGQIFFSMLEGARDWGATSMHQAFTVSAATATWYQIASFGLVFLLVFLIKGRGNAPSQGAPAAAPPVAVEA
jgi:fucose permease